MEYDVIVVGGGPAGICSAIACGRKGIRVVLIEEDSVVGGSAVDMGVLGFCGEPIEGIHKEMREKLKQIDECYEQTNQTFLPWNFTKVADDFLEDAGVNVITGAKVIGAIREDRKVVGIEVGFSDFNRPHYIQRVFGKVIIDASGNGDVAVLVGCRYRFGREGKSEFNELYAPAKSDRSIQHLTWMYLCRDMRNEGRDPNKNCFGENYYRSNKLHHRRMKDNVWCIWNGSVSCDDPLDPIKLRKAQMISQKLLSEQFHMLRENDFEVVYVAPKIGIRETRRIVGRYTITINDILSGRKFEDSVCRGRWGVDIWLGENERSVAGSKEWIEVDKFYYIPYRALLPEGIDNLILAGRCISGTHLAHSSYRVMTIASLIGQVAGLAGVIAVKNNVNLPEIDVKYLQESILADGITLV